jgi:hypothetical protein
MALTFQDNRLLDPRYQNMLLGRIRQMHGKGFQQDVQWGDVYNKQTGQYDFGRYDQLVNAARSRGLGDITFRLMGTPAYVESSRPNVDATLSASHPNAALAGKFAEQVAEHFRGRVGRYGVWNEPNIASFINQDTRKAASTYRQIYRDMYRSLKGVDPHNRVGFGEITSMKPTTKGTQSTLGFLNAVLAGPKPLHADYMSVHPYQWSNPAHKVGNAQYGGVSNLLAVQKALAQAARSGRLQTAKGGRVPLAVSEFGYRHNIGANAATRAAWLRKSMDLFKQAGVHDVNLYQLLPSNPGDSWDSSILGAQGQLPGAYKHLPRVA